ncbi:Aminotransferase class I/classII, partial [Trinorchestia longiramus]
MNDVEHFRDKEKFILREDLRTASTASNLAFNEKIKDLQESGRTIYNFGFGQSPFPAPPCFVRALQQWSHRTEYLPVRGLAALRREIINFHSSEDGFKLSTDHLIVGPGSKELLYLTMAVSNAVVLLPTPAWTTYAPQARMAGVKVVPLATSSRQRYKITPDILKAAVNDLKDETVFLILTNPGNPSKYLPGTEIYDGGTCYTQQELQALGAVCKSSSIVVLSDEIYARLKFTGRHASIVQHYPQGTILFSGFSKCASAGGWRLGYAHYPATLTTLQTAVLAAASQTYSCAPAPMQHAVAQSLHENLDEFKNYLHNCRTILAAVSKFCYRYVWRVSANFATAVCGGCQQFLLQVCEGVSALLQLCKGVSALLQ